MVKNPTKLSERVCCKLPAEPAELSRPIGDSCLGNLCPKLSGSAKYLGIGLEG